MEAIESARTVWNRSYIPWNVAGIVVAVIGFIIGSTKGMDGGGDTLTTIAAVLGTLGAAVAVVALVLEVLRRRRIRSHEGGDRGG